MAAVLAVGEGAVLSHLSAALLWGIIDRAGQLIHVLAADGGSRSRPGLAIHRTRHLPPEHRGEVDGIPVTSLHRTLLDCAAVLPRKRLRYAVEAADRMGLLDVRGLVALCDASSGKKGAGVLRRIALEQRGAANRSKSPPETTFLRLCLAYGLPEPLVNSMLHGYEVDFYWPQARLVVEIDTYTYHRSWAQRQRDLERDADLKVQRGGGAAIHAGADRACCRRRRCTGCGTAGSGGDIRRCRLGSGARCGSTSSPSSPSWFDWFATQRHVRNVVAAGSELRFIDYRETTPLGAGQVDDSPYGGGAGMVMRVDVVDAALRAAYGDSRAGRADRAADPVGADVRRGACDRARRRAGADPALRPLRGRRRARPRAPGHRRGLDRPLRPRRRRAGRDGRRRRGPAQAARGARPRRQRDEESFSDALEGHPEYPHYTRPATIGAGRCPTSSSPAITSACGSWRLERSRERGGAGSSGS